LNVNISPQGTVELFDLSIDRSEKVNLAASHPEIVKKMEGLMIQAHTPSTVFPFADEMVGHTLNQSAQDEDSN